MNTDKLLSELDTLVSEGRNPNTLDIDQQSSLELVKTINREDAQVANAVEACSSAIAECVDAIVNCLAAGGRLIYVGAGTSGRLGILDAVECLPTFSVPEGLVIGLIAGGSKALTSAVEGAEDSEDLAIADLKHIALGANDIVVGIAASGRTPYVFGAIDYATSIGAKTACIVCNPSSKLLALVDYPICAVVGPEVLTGSTRMKSGTAQKLILNTLSTAAMIRWGKAYENLMVDVKVTNKKLQARAIRIVMQATKCEKTMAEAKLAECNMRAKQAICAIMTNTTAAEAAQLLNKHNGQLRKAIQQYSNIK